MIVVVFMGCDTGTNPDTPKPQPSGISITGATGIFDVVLVIDGSSFKIKRNVHFQVMVGLRYFLLILKHLASP
jgi:hypothetical protein